MTEPRLVTSGTGWRVFRLGRAACVSIDRAGGGDDVEVWLNRPPNDLVRSSLLAALVAGAHGPVERDHAIEAMGADWDETRKADARRG